MYTTFFNLTGKPFESTPDPVFLWLGEKHREVLSTLRYGILENKGFLLLTGEAGTGKTTLINALTASFDKGVECAVISDPRLERLDFYNAIAKGFGIAKEFTSKVQFLIQFSHFLHKADDEKKKVLLLIDDCHRLSQDMLEELRLLSNIEKEDVKLINIFFVGQSEFNDMLVQPVNRAVRQRLTLKVELMPLNADETEEYIKYRLKVGGTEEKIFSAKALQIIYRISQGVPKRINIICDHAMVVGSVQGKRNIDHKVIEECAQKLNLPIKPSKEDFDGLADEKSHLEHFRGRFTAGSPEKPASVSGFNIENDHRRGWLTYALALVFFVLAGIYFWNPLEKFSDQPSLDNQKVKQGIVVEKVKQPAAEKEIPQAKELSQVITSPAITMLEQNDAAINVKKAAELKQAILEKAYSNNENSRQEETALATATTEKTESAGAIKETPLGDATKQTEGVKGARVEGKGPLEPTRLILGLAPNSLSLTAEADKEYKKFLAKLKLYPRARLLVKGFVSSKTSSAENDKLSLERAMGVHKLLVASGIEPARLEVKGMGIQEPIGSNDTIEGRNKNRRVEIFVVNDGR